MTAADALRKIGLLRRVKTENGASAAEAENAARLASALMARHTIKANEVLAEKGPAFKLTWVYWQQLFNEFGLQFSHFGDRGSAKVGADTTIYLRLRTGQWWVEKRSSSGSHTSARNSGVESLRKYLNEHARGYSLYFRR